MFVLFRIPGQEKFFKVLSLAILPLKIKHLREFFYLLRHARMRYKYYINVITDFCYEQNEGPMSTSQRSTSGDKVNRGGIGTTAKRLRISQRQLRYWKAQKFLYPVRAPAKPPEAGKRAGRPRGAVTWRPDTNERILAAIVHELVKARLPAKRIRYISWMLRRVPTEYGLGTQENLSGILKRHSTYLLIFGRDQAIETSEQILWRRMETATAQHASVMLLNLSLIAKQE
jgi:hypothetical protein